MENRMSWHRCLLDDLKAVDATQGSTEHSKLVFGVEAEAWTVEEGGKVVSRGPRSNKGSTEHSKLGFGVEAEAWTVEEGGQVVLRSRRSSRTLHG